MATDKEIYDSLCTLIKCSVPGFEVRFKNESWSQKLLALLAKPFCPDYMTRFTTTLFPKVYFPSRQFVEGNYRSAWKVLTHEYAHLWDRQKEGRTFDLRYALPQLLAIFALGVLAAFWSLWALLALVFLLALAPWPSRGRTDIEMRGYGMSMAVDYWRYGSINPGTKDWIAGIFVGWSYYRMSASLPKVKAQLDAIEKQIADSSILSGDYATPYRDVYLLLKNAGVVR
jgi:hypothetical protein